MNLKDELLRQAAQSRARCHADQPAWPGIPASAGIRLRSSGMCSFSTIGPPRRGSTEANPQVRIPDPANDAKPCRLVGPRQPQQPRIAGRLDAQNPADADLV